MTEDALERTSLGANLRLTGTRKFSDAYREHRGSLLGALLLVGLLTLPVVALVCATTMRAVGGCTRLPSVEQCQSASLRVSNECLRRCVLAQCSGVTVRCGDQMTAEGCSQPRED